MTTEEKRESLIYRFAWDLDNEELLCAIYAMSPEQVDKAYELLLQERRGEFKKTRLDFLEF